MHMKCHSILEIKELTEMHNNNWHNAQLELQISYILIYMHMYM